MALLRCEGSRPGPVPVQHVAPLECPGTGVGYQVLGGCQGVKQHAQA